MDINYKRFVLCWVIRIGIFFIPVLPIFFFLREINCIWTEPLLYLVIPAYVSPFWLRRMGELSRVEDIINAIQIFPAWLPVFFFLYYWLLTFPELKWIILSSLLLIMIPGFRSKIFIVPLLFLYISLLYGVAPIFVGFYLIGIAVVIVATLYLQKQNALSLPVWIPVILFSVYGSVLSVVAHVYTCNQRDLSPKIACQYGIEPISPLDYADLSRNSELPFHDISSFCVTDDGRLILLPRHQDQMICLKKGRKPMVFKTKGEFTDNLILDRNRKYAYFTSGRNLWRTSLKRTAIKRLHKFDTDLINDPPGIEPNYVRANPNPALKQILVQYDVDNGLFIYDLEKNCSRRVLSPYMLIESIWHPDGKKIISYGIDKSSFVGHFTLMNLQGSVLAHRHLIPFDDISLTPTISDEFFAAFFHRSKMERISVNTLETSWTLDVEEGTPRAALESEAHGCLIVPSYARGILSVYRISDKFLLQKMLIGKRVRAITPASDWGSYWISSSAGLFSMNLTEVLKGSYGYEP